MKSLWVVLGFGLLLAAAAPEDTRQAERRGAMVRNQIVSRGLTDPATLRVMGLVKRHLFVPETAAADAYEDRPLPIGYGQTISQPYIVAYMTALLQLRKEHRVLEIGTGSGYQAAILAELVQKVFTVEIIPGLGNKARERLAGLGYRNVEVRIADGYDGWAEQGPFDAIVVTAASEHIPPPLIRQLKDGGRMVIPVGSPFLVQTLTLVTKRGGEIRTTQLMPVRFVPFRRGP
ncbi:MAG: Protein-L-isoaspartate O-methyltransferase [Syntrophaceae bacterium PtaB.Bin095]|nr:MAG: Protein-L-isoaspartate O-methyltransferase [Syntrophaceae bacterium PtaB.Bin095]